MPGDEGVGGGILDIKQVGGTFCLLKYKKPDPQGRECIDSSQLFRIDYNDGPQCINVDGEFESYSWERTYDWTVSFPIKVCTPSRSDAE